MADKHARILTQPSNRAKAKGSSDKKVVFKSALANPHVIQWPSVPINLQNNILTYVTQALEGASYYRTARNALNRKRKRSTKAADFAKQNKKPKSHTDLASKFESETNGAAVTSSVEDIELQPQAVLQVSEAPDPPAILRHIVYGINEVTKRLEIQAQRSRRPIIVATSEPSLPPLLETVFVCRADVDPAILVDHLPHLVAACNSSNPSSHVKLVPLPRGSELTIAKVLGVRRVTALAIDRNSPKAQQLKLMLDQVPVLSASWLSNPKPSHPLIGTHVKHLRTTAPKDMKAAKESRNQERADAKRRKKLLKAS
ncbi:hypothetical protein CPB84DRAFT_1760415 [Gymnopilus junonius]|uniref:Uncharacterized protein n=1 Tax=Gymnopilus junonius TaxID=109634 RepID=A0A9P5P0Z0_GYMJU|nr:hypothetical protein CPB84DRAFT_1760415 [Gymnopilus junonius]